MKIPFLARITLCCYFLVCFAGCSAKDKSITIVKDGKTNYVIVIPSNATSIERKSAELLQTYLQKIAGVKVPVKSDSGIEKQPAIYIGNTPKAIQTSQTAIPAEGYLIQTSSNSIIIKGGTGRGVINGVYKLLEQIADCQFIDKYCNTCKIQTTLTLPQETLQEAPAFQYREVYYPQCLDANYLQWNKLHRFEELWGLWGHSYNKLVPPATYFAQHPEYYALVNGKRVASQLCLSQPEVLNIVIAELKKKIADNPDALYWSISPNDDNGWCRCPLCSKIDDAEGTPAASLVQFVNKVAAAIPQANFTTLAYGYTHSAPKSLKPAPNVYIFLSTIDAYRDNPLATEGSAATFRKDLKAWTGLTPNVFVWDYVTQFTNYLAPFPNFNTLQANMQYLKSNGVKGIFVQGSGDTYGELAELRSYLIAKLLYNPEADITSLTNYFLKNYYGTKAAPFISEYLTALQANRESSHRKLDIYGNPVNEWKTYLSPSKIDEYSTLLDKAEAATEGNALYAQRLMRIRLSLDYTVLQQARFFGIEKYGIFVKDDKGEWIVKPGFAEKVKRFVENCKKAGVKELSEDGLSPDKYLAEWEAIFKTGVTPSKALYAKVSFQNSYVEDYPANGDKTLTDGAMGYNDFSYNWLCFYNTSMVATVNLGSVMSINSVNFHFLDDPRHWIFVPSKVTIEVSQNGIDYKRISSIIPVAGGEHYNTTIKQYAVNTGKNAQVQYIRITATCPNTLPEWRQSDTKKPMIACDEVWVQ
ncbi:MAG: DUF4838 domain-containing protein [Chitinophagia bacterium]|nr:DUF4838 domain-containing protein [Chitinophagia bacterium]